MPLEQRQRSLDLPDLLVRLVLLLQLRAPQGQQVRPEPPDWLAILDLLDLQDLQAPQAR